MPFFVFFRFGGMPRAKGLFRAKVSDKNVLEKIKNIEDFNIQLKSLFDQSNTTAQEIKLKDA